MSLPYRAYFLGPLPHLLLCLDIVHTHAQKQKKQLGKDWIKAEYTVLEQLGKKMRNVQQVLKDVIELQRGLNPTATFHATEDLQELKRLAEKAVAILEALPFGTPPGVQNNLAIAFKGVLKPRSAPKQCRTEPRPRLNTEEET
ncbi:hypothetical protein C8J57DRAFT_1270668 [Mycena rebaudengoi]|nr:hypothetical protein C8J57DRAFT_1270668 [Mycena rebaudengoi]